MNPIDPFSSTFEGLNTVVHLLADMRSDKAPNVVGLPAGQGHNGPERGARGLLEQSNHARRLGIGARHNRLLGWTGRSAPAVRFVAA
jgi:hypothetical protein